MAINSLNNKYSELKAYTLKKNKTAIDKATIAIDEMLRNGDKITFDAVAKKAGIARSTLYCNQAIKERIKNVRTVSVGGIGTGNARANAESVNQSANINALHRQITELKAANQRIKEERDSLIQQKKQLIVQLVHMEELKDENLRFKNRFKGKSD